MTTTGYYDYYRLLLVYSIHCYCLFPIHTCIHDFHSFIQSHFIYIFNFLISLIHRNLPLLRPPLYIDYLDISVVLVLDNIFSSSTEELKQHYWTCPELTITMYFHRRQPLDLQRPAHRWVTI